MILLPGTNEEYTQFQFPNLQCNGSAPLPAPLDAYLEIEKICEEHASDIFGTKC